MRLQFTGNSVFDGRLMDEIGLRMRLSRGNNGLVNTEVIATDGVSTFGSAEISVAGSNEVFVEQVVNLKLSALKNLEAMYFDVYNRRVV
jgi:hypothetical protein